jgi:RNA polymerase sporulation-specific sigma factor
MKYCLNDDEFALICAFRAGDESAFNSLVELYTPMLKRVALSMSLDFDETFSDACYAFYRAAQTYDLSQNEVTFGLFARICVRNRIVDLLRSAEHEVNLTDYDVEMMTEGESVESKIADREEFELILGSAKRLLSDYEYSVLLLHIQGYKTAAIAKALGRTAKSVDNAKSRLFRRLRSEICSISDN